MPQNNPKPHYLEYTAIEIANRAKELPRYGKEKYLRFEDVRNLLIDIQAEVSGDDGRASFRRK